MEKRVVIFLVASMALVWGYIFLQQALLPPPPVAKKDAERKVERKDVKPGEAAPQPEADPQPDHAADEDPQPAGQEIAAAADAQQPDARSPPQQFGTLGSLDPKSGYPFLVTWNSRGATIERIELTSLRYRDLDDPGGYLGHLALTDSPRGCRVNVVPPGTPAAVAQPVKPSDPVGLQVGDIIQSAAGKPVRNVEAFARLMYSLRPKERLQLTVLRPTGDENRPGRQVQYIIPLVRPPLQIINPGPQTGVDATEFTYVPREEYGPLSCLLSLARIGDHVAKDTVELADLPSLRNSQWQVEPLKGGPGEGVEFRLRLEAEELEPLGITGPLEIIKRYRLTPNPKVNPAKPLYPAYQLGMEIEFRNLAEEPLELAYRLDGPNGLPLEGWWYTSKVHPSRWFTTGGARDVAWGTKEEGHHLLVCRKIYSNAIESLEEEQSPDYELLTGEAPAQLGYIGVDALYFAAMLMPAKNDVDKFVYARAAALPVENVLKMEEDYAQTTNVSFYVVSPPITIPAQDSFQQEFILFAGPKEPDLLARYNLSSLIVYGFFSPIAKLMVDILHIFYLIVGNYGLAIVMLTILVRGCMFPISRKAAKNAQMMQELAPEMKKINEKYKTDMEKRTQAQRELWRKHNYNPLGGCLLMFLQLPIFIGLYKALSVDIELRQAPLIPVIQWAANLAGPDKLLYWRDYLPFFTSPTGWLGPYLNILPLVTVVLFLFHQKMFTPPATDDQTRLQQKMMKFMTIFIGVLFFKVPSGLCLYFISSSLWGIAERKLLPSIKKDTDQEPAEVELPRKTKQPAPAGNGSSRRERLKRQKKK